MNKSTLVPREEMSDLDWLARNVHVWPFNMFDSEPTEKYVWHQPYCGGDILAIFRDRPSVFTKDQWLARRAELQNKPSWVDFRESAKFMAQDSDGAWRAFEIEPTAQSHIWNAKRGWRGYAYEETADNRGEVLGNWRDTLEKRPEQKAFKPLTSIENNQGQEMKQDNGWFERGELPPVGTECEIDLGAKWRKAFVVGRNYTGRIVVEVDTCDFIVADGCTFRPIRTERDVLIEIIKKTDDTDDRIADAILAAGFSLGAK